MFSQTVSREIFEYLKCERCCARCWEYGDERHASKCSLHPRGSIQVSQYLTCMRELVTEAKPRCSGSIDAGNLRVPEAFPGDMVAEMSLKRIRDGEICFKYI